MLGVGARHNSHIFDSSASRLAEFEITDWHNKGIDGHKNWWDSLSGESMLTRDVIEGQFSLCISVSESDSKSLIL